MSLLDSVLSHLPIGSHEWECVASDHNEKFPDKDRALELQFKVKNPTDDPTCPPKVRYTKRVILKRYNVSSNSNKT